jgi:FHS family L-fucose permease-like MFS transporter
MVMMMTGRFIGTYLMKYIAPNKLLAEFALGSILMCLVVAQSWGLLSFMALLMINFFFSIMFPTIFSLGLKNLGEKTQQGSSFLVMGVVGGAVFPPLMGLIADKDVASFVMLSSFCLAPNFIR